jgi:outer membrane protein
MKRITLIAAFFITALITGQQLAGQTIKFGHVNRNELIQSMPEFDSAKVKLEKLNTELSNALELLQVEYNNKAEAYLKDSKTLTDIVRQTKEQELQDYQKRMTDFQTNAQNQLQEKQAELFKPITDKADKAIKDVGKENGFLYIFDLSQNGVAYYDETRSTNVMPLVKTKLGLK